MKMHLSLAVENIEKTQTFYDQLFDSKPAKRKQDYLKYDPESLPLNISFHTGLQEIDVNRHLGIQFDSQASLDVAHERLQKAGLISQKKESSICCYANQDKFWVTDPNGYEWELYYLLEDTDIKIDTQTNCCNTEASGQSACR